MLISFKNPLIFTCGTMVIGVAWSLYNEMFCWMLMPAILKNSTFKTLMMITGVIYCLATIGWHVLNPEEPISAAALMALPAALLPFCAGMFIFTMKREGRLAIGNRTGVFAMIGYVMLLVAVKQHWIEEYLLGFHLSLLLNCIIIAYLSQVSLKDYRVIDRFLGDLSYPIYIIHLQVILGASIFLSFQPVNGLAFRLSVIVMTLMLAACLHVVVEKPVNRLRNALKS
jgi:peptidoglycan/LPS O-acetylase OafA/YrhL